MSFINFKLWRTKIFRQIPAQNWLPSSNAMFARASNNPSCAKSLLEFVFIPNLFSVCHFLTDSLFVLPNCTESRGRMGRCFDGWVAQCTNWRAVSRMHGRVGGRWSRTAGETTNWSALEPPLTEMSRLFWYVCTGPPSCFDCSIHREKWPREDETLCLLLWVVGRSVGRWGRCARI